MSMNMVNKHCNHNRGENGGTAKIVLMKSQQPLISVLDRILIFIHGNSISQHKKNIQNTDSNESEMK